MQILSLLLGTAFTAVAAASDEDSPTYQVRTALEVLRSKRMNSGFFEETRDDNFERECNQEMCSKEELREIFPDDEAKAAEKWAQFTRQCYVNKCNAQGTRVCVQTWNKRTCTCKEGWTGEDCGTDKDECAEGGNICGGRVCINTQGSYTCGCPSGYKDDGATCVDINECEDATLNTCTGPNETCENDEGTHSCGCQSGFSRLVAGANCTDIDECADGHDGQDVDCGSGTCKNHDGGFICECPEGTSQTITDQIKTCTDLCSPGQTYENGICTAETTTMGVGQADSARPETTYEPTTTTANVKQTKADVPEFTPTSTAEPDGTDKPATTMHEVAAPTARPNTPGEPNASGCDKGLELDGETCVDIDECYRDQDKCPVMCMNYYGSYFCYDNIQKEQQMCHHTSAINSTDGNYMCTCYDGYHLCYDLFSCISNDDHDEYDNQGRFKYNSLGKDMCNPGEIGINNKCYAVGTDKKSYASAMGACFQMGGKIAEITDRETWWVLGNHVANGYASFWINRKSEIDIMVFGSNAQDNLLANMAENMDQVPPQFNVVDGDAEHLFVCELNNPEDPDDF